MKQRNQSGLTLTELLVSIVIISVILVPILNFFNLSINSSNRFREISKLKFIAEEEIEKFISIDYRDPSIDTFANGGGRTNFFEKADYIVKTHVIFLDPDTGEVPDLYPVKESEDTHLKRITVSVARKDRIGGQVDLIYFKSP